MLFNPVEYLLRGVAVSLNFPNTSRSYNPAHRSIMNRTGFAGGSNS